MFRKLLVFAVPILIMLVAVAGLCTLTATASGVILMKPYLQAVTTNSIYVLVECDNTNPVRVQYGKTASYGMSATTESTAPTTASPVTYVHRIKLTGLEADTLYHYKVAPESGSPYPDATFYTAVNPGTNFRLAFLADQRAPGTAIHDGHNMHMLSMNPRFSLYGGDICNSAAYDRFKSDFFRAKELDLCSQVPFFNATGNHEKWDQNTKAFTWGPGPSRIIIPLITVTHIS